jgi:exopolysaccharide production protein ExoQ
VIVLTSTMVSWYGLSGFGRRMQIVTGLIMIASVLTALLFPRVGVHHAYDLLESVHAGNWRGVFIHKNVLGGVAVMSMIYSLRSIRNETRPWQVFFSMARISSVICCIMAGSVAAWGGGLIAVTFIILMKHRATANPLFICAMILIGAALVQGLSLSAERIAEALGRDPTFTGRTEIWALGWPMIQSHLLFGSGFATDAAVFGELAKRNLAVSAMDLHSGYLDVLFNLGLVGAAFLALAVGVAMLRGYIYTQTFSGDEREQAVIFMTLVVAACAIAAAETAPFALMGDGAIGLWTALPALYQLRLTARKRRWRAVPVAGRAT